MTTFSAAEYRLAAKIAEEYALPRTAELWKAQADQVQRREHYAEKLGMLVVNAAPPFANGVRILKELQADGWTPPAELA